MCFMGIITVIVFLMIYVCYDSHKHVHHPRGVASALHVDCYARVSGKLSHPPPYRFDAEFIYLRWWASLHLIIAH